MISLHRLHTHTNVIRCICTYMYNRKTINSSETLHVCSVIKYIKTDRYWTNIAIPLKIIQIHVHLLMNIIHYSTCVCADVIRILLRINVTNNVLNWQYITQPWTNQIISQVITQQGRVWMLLGFTYMYNCICTCTCVYV